MRLDSQTRIVDTTRMQNYRKYIDKCLVGLPSNSCQRRKTYLRNSIPRGFHKRLLIHNKEVVGQIEYSPSEVSYYPIRGENLIVMNCIWVLRRAKGHGFGRQLLKNMIDNEKDASGFATVALESHWSPWFRKEQIEKLGFKTIDSIRVAHKTKHKKEAFNIHLMWMPNTTNARTPAWNKLKLLEGMTACIAHQLYHPKS